MGMYTELHFNAEIIKDAPEEVIEILEYMVNKETTYKTIPNHEFFITERWKSLFSSDSYYFSADTHSTFRYDKIGQCYYLCVRSNIKNYGSEIEKFIDWIMPYVVSSDEFLGFYRYEESREPTLIYKESNHKRGEKG